MKILNKLISVFISTVLVFSVIPFNYLDAFADNNYVSSSQSLDENHFYFNSSSIMLSSYDYISGEFTYADQLTNDQAGIYNQLVNATTEIKETNFTYTFTQNISLVTAAKTLTDEILTTFKQYTQNTLGYALQAFLNDYPTVFWLNRDIDYKYSYVFTELDTGYLVTLKSIEVPVKVKAEYGSVSNVLQLKIQYDNFINSFNPTSETRYGKLNEIQNKICLSASYNENGIYANSSAGVFISPYQAVCEGYATAFKVLCDKYGIPCVIISGSTTNNLGHMWCYVQMDNLKWYAVDPTWDDNDTNNSVNFEYFLKGSSLFDKEHISSQAPSGIVLQTPILENDDYNPTQNWIEITSINNLPENIVTIGYNESIENIYKILGTEYSINGTDEIVDLKWECSYFDGRQTGRYIFSAVPLTDGYYLSESCNSTIVVDINANYNALPLDFTSIKTNVQGNGYSWNYASKTLTLTDFKQIVYFDDAIKLPAQSTLIVNTTDNKESIIKCMGGNSKASIYCEGDIYIQNSSSLQLAGNSQYGIYAEGSINLDNSLVNIKNKEFGFYASNKTVNILNHSSISMRDVINGLNCAYLTVNNSFINISAEKLPFLELQDLFAKASNILLYSNTNSYLNPNNSVLTNTFMLNSQQGRIYGDTAHINGGNVEIGTKNILADIVIESGQTLFIDTGSTLVLNGSLCNNGRLVNMGEVINNGDITNSKKFISVGTFINNDGANLFISESTIDCNGDGVLTVADMVLLRKHIIDPIAFPYDMKKVDMNYDGRLSVIDLLTFAFEMLGRI